MTYLGGQIEWCDGEITPLPTKPIPNTKFQKLTGTGTRAKHLYKVTGRKLITG